MSQTTIDNLKKIFLNNQGNELIALNGERNNSIELSKNTNRLIRFIMQWRSTDIQINDPFINNWLTKIAPSCVYPMLVNGNKAYYSCVICKIPCIRQQNLIRHYKEQHHSEMPKDIFGKLSTFECKLCKCSFSRKQHLEKHFESLDHLNRLDDRSVIESYNDAKNEWQTRKCEKRKADFQKECEDWDNASKKMKLSESETDNTIINGILNEIIEKVVAANNFNRIVRTLSDDLIKNLAF